MYGNDTAPWLNQIQGVKATNALPTVNHEQNVLQSAASELTAASFNGDVVVEQVNLPTAKVAYWNKFNLADLEGYYTQKYLPRGANYDIGETESVLATLLADSIPNVISKQVENLTWRGDTSLGSGTGLQFVDGFNVLHEALSPTSTGTLTLSNTRGYVDGLINAAVADADWSAALSNGGARIYMGHDAYRFYATSYRSDFGSLPYNNEFNKMVIDGTNVSMIPCAGLTGTNYVYLAKNDILTIGTDLDSDQNNIMMGFDQFEEYVWVKCKFRLGFASRDVNTKSVLVHRGAGNS
jgi:hypothetical protein